MKKLISMILCAVMAAGLMTGCGNSPASEEGNAAKVSSQEANVQENTADKSAESAEPVTITAWHDNDEAMMNALADIVNKQLEGENITLKFEKKSDVTGQIQLYGTDAANGPDMYLFAHDSLGSFVQMGILEPVDALVSNEAMADLIPMTVEAATYDGKQYLMPVYYETLLFMYNKDLWEGDLPSTTEDLYDYMETHTDALAGTYALVNQHSNAYNVAPYIYGFGGYLIDKDGTPGLDAQATKDAVSYNKKFAALEADGDYNTVTALFNEGKASAIIGGPWLISGIKEAGINLGIKALSDFALPDGNSMKPFSGVQCLGVLKYAAESKKDAVGKVLEVLAKPEVGIELAKNFNCAPANSKAYDEAEVASNEMILAMKQTAEVAVPMPNVPEMGVMWGPTESFLTAVNKSGQEVDAAAEQYQKEALTAIADMQ
ncbi:MAG: extracellular solute-binding protein [Lachnospiraceae bacterium]